MQEQLQAELQAEQLRQGEHASEGVAGRRQLTEYVDQAVERRFARAIKACSATACDRWGAEPGVVIGAGRKSDHVIPAGGQVERGAADIELDKSPDEGGWRL